MINRIYNLVVTAIASVPAVVGLALAAPAAAGPGLGQQICGAFDKAGGLTLRNMLVVEIQLDKKGVPGDRAIRQSVAADCPKYQAALAEADREAAIENQRINGNY